MTGNAGQTAAGFFSGVAMYDYDFVLPTPFQTAASSNYWIQIEATQQGIPDWGIATGTGNGYHFLRTAYVGDIFFTLGAGDAAFTLLTSDAAIYSVSASASPTGSGTITGAGLYPTGMSVPLVAAPSASFAFVNWTENGLVVGSSPTYNFTVSSNRALVANYAPGSTITTTAYPASGGSTTGDGNYTNGASVTITATTNANYAFVNWTVNGTPVSTNASYTFTVTTNQALVANFASSVVNLAVLFSQPPSASAGAIPSSFYSPNGFDGDGYAFDSFVLGSTQDITDLQWRGAYRYGYSTFNPVVDFTISIYSSIGGGSQPDVGGVFAANPLAQFAVGGNAFETPDVAMFDHHFTLPASFHAVAGTKYWVQIEASQTNYPNDWGIATSTVGDGTHYQQTTAGPTYIAAGDVAFTLLAPADTNSSTIVTSAQPVSGGTTSGDGIYANAATATVMAAPSPGYVFVSWSTNGVVASTNATYQFTVSTNRTLAANFELTFTLSLTASPAAGGTVAGAGTYTARSSVSAVAAPNPGYSFVNWTEGGVAVSAATSYTFNIAAARTLIANYALIPLPMTLINSARTDLTIGWHPAVTGWVLQESPDLSPGSWTNSTRTVTITGSELSVTITPLTGNTFFRLYHP